MSTDFNSLRELVKAGALIPGNGGIFDPPSQRTSSSSLLFNSSGRARFDTADYSREDGLLSYDLIRSIARRSALVKPAVDFVVRTLSTTPYRIRSIDGARVPKKAIRRAEELFIKPMAEMGNATFRDLLGALLRDVVVLDHGIVLKHRNGDSLEAFEVMDSATFLPVPDNSGRLKGWVQKIDGTIDGKFKRDDIIPFIMNTRSNSLFGEPAIESVIHEINAALNASKSFSSAFDKNEIPPGILFLLGAQDSNAVRRLQRDVKRSAGIDNDYALRILSGMDDAKWITFQRQFREMQVAELMTTLQRTVWRALGVDRVAMGDVEEVNRSTSEALIMTRNYSLFKPILDMLADKFTYELLREIHDGLYIEFIHYSRTGAETDLVTPQFVRPTGFAEDDYDMVQENNKPKSNKPKSENDQQKKACGGCGGRAYYKFTINGDEERIPCSDCDGTGWGGPLFVSRPSRLLLPESVQQQRVYRKSPRKAWHEFASGGQKERLSVEVDIVKGNLIGAYSCVNSAQDLIQVVDRTKRQLSALFTLAYEEAAKIVTLSKKVPSIEAVTSANRHVYDFVRFQANPRIVQITNSTEATRAALELSEDAVALCDLTFNVAGRVLAEAAD